MKKSLSLAAGITGSLPLISSPVVHAHCPLCTAGAGAMAGAAALMGIRYGAIGIFIGGFATATSLWLLGRVKKQYIPFQKPLLFAAIYLSILLPVIPLTKDYSSVYVSLFGDYGGLFNRTYLINWFLVGSLTGSLLVYFSPRLSGLITNFRKGRKVKFQGLILTFSLLILSGALMQVLL